MEFDNMDVKNNIILAMDLMFVNQLTSTLTLLKSDIH